MSQAELYNKHMAALRSLEVHRKSSPSHKRQAATKEQKRAEFYAILKIYCDEDAVSICTPKLPNALLSLGMNFSDGEVARIRTRALSRRPRGSRGHVNVFDLLEILVPEGQRADLVGSNRNFKVKRHGRNQGGKGGRGVASGTPSPPPGPIGVHVPSGIVEAAPGILQARVDHPEIPPSPKGVKREALGGETAALETAQDLRTMEKIKTNAKRKKKIRKAKKKRKSKQSKKMKKAKKGRKIFPLDTPLYDLGMEALQRRDAAYMAQLKRRELEALDLAQSCREYLIERKWPSAVERLKSGLPPAEIMYSWADGKRLRGGYIALLVVNKRLVVLRRGCPRTD